MISLSVLTVDDEPLSLLRLEQTLPSIPHITHVGAAFGASEAIDKIKGLKPDVVLLDIRLRDGSGFDVVERLPQDSAAEIIFVTAFDEFATRAFETHAVDYVMKPVSTMRLGAALDRARERIETRGARAQMQELKSLVQELNRATREERVGDGEPAFWIKTRGGDLASIHTRDIDWVRSEEDYTRVHTRFGEHLIRGSLRAFLQRFGAKEFIRIHRNTLIRRAAIRRIHKSGLVLEVELSSGERLHAGRVYAKRLRDEISAT